MLANDTDPLSRALTAVLISEPSHGSLSFNANGTHLSYTPATNFYGSDSFSYEDTDGIVTSAPATVTIEILQPGRPHLSARTRRRRGTGSGHMARWAMT